MFLSLVFLQYVSICSASLNVFDCFNYFGSSNDENLIKLARHKRQTRRNSYDDMSPSCDQLAQTAASPFVVILLYKTSGRFLGMGSIIDKKTVITASPVVEQSMKVPNSLLILAGRFNAWWGKDSQVQPASEIFQAEPGLALVSLKHELHFNKNVAPIKIPDTPAESFTETYGKVYGVFGIQRSSWDIPGDLISKAQIYVMRLESAPEKNEDCLHTYPDLDFNSTNMICTFANGSFAWGCIGSPTVGVTKKDDKLQIAVVIKTTSSETETFHFHLRIAFYEQWIRAHSLLGFKKQK